MVRFLSFVCVFVRVGGGVVWCVVYGVCVYLCVKSCCCAALSDFLADTKHNIGGCVVGRALVSCAELSYRQIAVFSIELYNNEIVNCVGCLSRNWRLRPIDHASLYSYDKCVLSFPLRRGNERRGWSRQQCHK